MNRYVILLAGFVMMLGLGIITSWSVFVRPLMLEFNWSATDVTLVFTVYYVIFALTMPLAGHLQDRFGPRKVAVIGGLLVGSGFILASLIDTIPSPLWLYATYGLITGTGCGLAYSVSSPVAVKWFPEKQEFAVGIVVMGFGMSALIFAPLERYLIDHVGIGGAFLYIGFFLLLLTVLPSFILRNPDREARVLAGGESQTTNIEMGPKDIIKTRQFYILWMNFCLMISIGFIVLSHIAAYAELRGISPYLAALTSSVFGVSNAFGRPGIYLLSRKFGIERTMLLVFASQAIFMFLIPYSGNTALFALIAFAGIMYGANLSLFPALIAEYFGKANLGANYGLIFTAVAAAALLGPLSGSIIFDVLGGYDRAFLLAAIMAGVALFLGFFLRKPSVGDY